jgi:hypothetical protein
MPDKFEEAIESIARQMEQRDYENLDVEKYFKQG